MNILQRIGSILNSEWETHQEPETVLKNTKKRKKERKKRKTKIRIIHSTHRYILLEYVCVCALEAINE